MITAHKPWRDGSLLIGWCAVIFILSHQPAIPVPLAFPHADKFSHFVAYAIMGWLAWGAFSHRWRGTSLLRVTIVFCALYGASDEYHQSFVEGRFSELADWLADTVGAFVVTVARYLRGR